MFLRTALVLLILGISSATTACLGGAIYLVVDNLSVSHDGMSGAGEYEDHMIVGAGTELRMELAVETNGEVGAIGRSRYELRADPSADIAIYLDPQTWEFHWTPTEQDIGLHVLPVELWAVDGDTPADELTIEIEVVRLEQFAEELIEFGFIMDKSEFEKRELDDATPLQRAQD